MQRKHENTDRPPARVLHHWLKLRSTMNKVANQGVLDDVQDFEVVMEQDKPGRWSVSIRVKEDEHDLKISTAYTFYRGMWRGHGLKVTENGEDQGNFGDDMLKAITALMAKRAERSTEGQAEGTNTRGTGYGSVSQRGASVIRN